MARGMVVNEPIVSQAQTKAYDEGYDRIFGANRSPQRGRYVYVPELGRCVSMDEYETEQRALDAPIMVDRFMEGARTVDGVDIGSRRKRAEYLKATGLAPADDFSPQFMERARAEREALPERQALAALREQFERAALKSEAQYRKEAAEAQRRRLERDRRASRDVDD